MDLSKNTVIAIVAVAVIVVAGVAILASGAFDEKEVGVTYDGNGGATDGGKTSTVLANSEAVDGKMFVYENHIFLNWNTRADGTGETYHVGDKVSTGLKLYAQWTGEIYAISNFTSSGTVLKEVTYTINDRTAGFTTQFSSPAIFKINGGSGWTFDGDHTFTGTVNGKQYKFAVMITGYTAGTLISEVYDGAPTIGFETTQDIGLSISVTPVR